MGKYTYYRPEKGKVIIITQNYSMENIVVSDQRVVVACNEIINSKSDMLKFWLSDEGKILCQRKKKNTVCMFISVGKSWS
jgi:hypothetical protein